ncbi:competence protein ComEA [Pedobacter sp. UYP24]
MRKWLNNYFDFTKSEFNGLLALIVAIVLITFAPSAYSFFATEDHNDDDQFVIKRLILSENSESNKVVRLKNSAAGQTNIKFYKHDKLFLFDPNTIGITEWISLGLSPKQAAGVLKYTSKGGRFKMPADIRKMYTISPAMADKLLPFVSIKQADLPDANIDQAQHKTFDNKNIAIVKPVRRIIELNFADSADLDEIKGVGPAFATRILKYRERIGGFYRKEQLLEVFGLDSAKYLEIKDQVHVDESAIRKINVNTAQMEDFKNNPYIRYKQVNAILQYRKQHGNFNNTADLLKIAILTPEVVSHISPYLTF